MNIISPHDIAGTTVQLVFVLPRATDEGDSASTSACTPKLFVRAEELPAIFSSEKVAKILAKHCLTPVVQSASRLKLYWLGDVVAVADRLRRGEISVNVAEESVFRKSTPNTSS
jgi:hypothetical protein